ncbi:hypothetical protein EJ02DRAFT_425379 [Clathrospora elynae]|uniref:Uncharacterized protein n=1 Tax=Clathrospora elynae TaxID=706981 RepID=A0A6A5SDT3_9PLEO|nr:hypothetical protein EJ02DRAFT_425379 [Clathrospora elynae]
MPSAWPTPESTPEPTTQQEPEIEPEIETEPEPKVIEMPRGWEPTGGDQQSTQ